MRWLLAGCCGLVLIHFSAAQNLTLVQRPRFYGVKIHRTVQIYCGPTPQHNMPATVQWYKAEAYDKEPEKRAEVSGERIGFHNRSQTENAFLYIKNVQLQDSGVYFCKVNDAWGPGTQLVAVRPVDLPQALYRTKMKDGLIIFQGLLLAVCIAALLLRKQTLWEKNDSIYEEPETDHIYEGLAIETCGGGLYEELSVYAQAEGAEAPWE
ncbi:B-cell antigen receptor complex-associated protein beta chain [Xiphias gladius]|uniref:B-cell antigen receptor complex-associated protein beta chain n=1 Tax=Xiphias gladius TaxID=8245 RepID=UPI001A99EB1E|nr:B-cell antigen receptor complex-associated protein beta chain [Xiphias gladius]